jgi:hypothetical protein
MQQICKDFREKRNPEFKATKTWENGTLDMDFRN